MNGEGNFADTSSRRIYDIHTGRAVVPKESRRGVYKHAFVEDLEGALRINGFWKEQELDEYGNELPAIVLDPLQRDLALAQRDVLAHAHVSPATQPATEKEHEEVSS
jgi:hypothetical protein